MALTDFSAKVADHFLNPRKLGVLTEKDIAPPAERLLVGDSGQVTRGDALRITLRLRAADETILDARFQNFGTGMPVAGASMLCTLLPGKKLDEALKITAEELDRELEGLPELKLRKPVLVLDALDNAVRKFRGLPAREKNPPGDNVVCSCFQVGEKAIERAIRTRGLRTLDEVIAATMAGAGCHTCHPDVEAILNRCRQKIFTLHLDRNDYEAAQKIYGAPEPSLEELAKNPPEPEQGSGGAGEQGSKAVAPLPLRSPAPLLNRSAPDGFVYPDKSPVAEAVAKKATPQDKMPRKPWLQMSEQERKDAIEYEFEHSLRPAIHADGGDIHLVALDGDRVRVKLSGHCQGCFSALSTLKLGVEKHLRERVWPEIEVEEVVY